MRSRWHYLVPAALGLLSLACAGDDRARPSGRAGELMTPADRRFARELEGLMPGLSARSLTAREEPQQRLELLCHQAGRPGADAERAALCRAMAARLGPSVAKPARVWLLRKLEPLARDEAVPHLAALLNDSDAEIRDLARRALQNNPAPAAADALRAAVARPADESWRVALIGALAARAERASVPLLCECAADPAPAVAAAALSALGAFDTDAALRTLLPYAARNDPRGAAAREALLRLAERIARADTTRASEVYAGLFDSPAADDVRLAALTGLACTAGAAAVPRLLEVVHQRRAAEHSAAALRLLSRVPGDPVTALLRSELGTLPGALQIVLLDAFIERNATSARVAILDCLASPEEAVRVAAADALGRLGDAGSTAPLLRCAAAASGPGQAAARRALAWLPADGVDGALLATLSRSDSDPTERVEAIRALGARRTNAARGALLGELGAAVPEFRAAALDALAQLGDARDLDLIVAALATEHDARVAQAGADCIVALAGELADAEQRSASVRAALPGAAGPGRSTLVSLLPRLASPAALSAVRAELVNNDAAVRSTAVRALVDWPSPEPLPELLQLAREADNPTDAVLALRGYVRLAGLPGEREASETFELLKAALPPATRVEERRLICAALGRIRSAAALDLLLHLCGEPDLRAEAASAACSAAQLVAADDRPRATAALEHLRALELSEAARARVDEARQFLDRTRGYLLSWEVAGPFALPAEARTALLEHMFSPEAGDAAVVWRPWSRRAADNAFVIDLTPLATVEGVCMYARTRFSSAGGGPARLELGSDDGIRIWLNGNLVHSRDANRPVRLAEDVVPVDLRAGDNELLLKVTQFGGGWGFACRVDEGPQRADEK